MSMIYSSAVVLLLLAVLILLRKLHLRWRGALLTGIAALWLWGMALSLMAFLEYCLIAGTHGARAVEPAAAALDEALGTCISVNFTVMVLSLFCSATFLIQCQATKSDLPLDPLP